MEKPNCLGIMKKSSKVPSWEELAFAEDDASGALWPPRSYTCSFCRIELRSAQALGGHMNVHRRDKARLKQADHQFLFSESHNNCDDDIHETSCYTLVFNSNSNHLTSQHSCAIDLSLSRVSSKLPSKQDPPSSKLHSKQDPPSPKLPSKQDPPSLTLKPSKNSKKILTTSSWPRSVTFGAQKPSEFYDIPAMERDKRRKMDRDVSKSGHQAKLNLGKTTDLSVSMNLVIHQSFPITPYFRDEEKEWDEFYESRRRHVSSLKPPISISRLANKNTVNSRNKEFKQRDVRSNEEIDLELRLGTDPPKKNWLMEPQNST